MAELDEYDAIPDAFEDIDFENIPGLQSIAPLPAPSLQPVVPLPSTPVPAQVPVPALSTPPSSQYGFDDDDMDDSFLLQVDAITEVATAAGAVPLSPTQVHNSPQPSRTGMKRKRTDSNTKASTPSPKARRLSSPVPAGTPQSSPGRRVREVLGEVEDDMSCPICCDIIACAHLGNPCGHTYCGACCWNWLDQKKGPPTCPICRTTLSRKTPMIPNFSLDNMVDKYVHALGQHTDAEWKPDAAKHVEWTQRKEKWKRDVAAREKAAKEKQRGKKAPGPTYVFNLATGVVEMAGMVSTPDRFVVPDDDDDDDYQGSDVEEMELIPRAPVRRPSRRLGVNANA